MKNMTIKLMLIAFALGFGIFFGVDIATKSHEKATGAAVTAASERSLAAVTDARQAGPPAPRPQKTARPEPPRLSEQGIPMPDSFLNRLSNKIGDAFRHLAKWIVGLLLALLESILG